MAPFKVLTWCKDMVEFEMDVIRFLILRKNLIFKVKVIMDPTHT
jgi:hypothetical protein